jgi:hypothetical protein
MRHQGVFLSSFFDKPVWGSAAASRNNVRRVPTNGSRPAKFTPGQPQRTESHGCDGHHCLSWDRLDVLGALSKAGINLLGLAAAEPQFLIEPDDVNTKAGR